MSRLTEHTKRIEEFEAAEVTAGALQDINAIRMQSIRRRFEKNRAFYDEIRELYRIVRASALREHPSTETAVQERLLLVAVTSDRRFAGTLTRDIISTLIAKLAEAPQAACLIIGRIGWQYFEQAGYASRGRQAIVAGDMPTREEFTFLLHRFAQFDRVLVYYSRFINSFHQEVAFEDITEYPDENKSSAESEDQQASYLFEPEVPAILAFFDSQVRYVLFERVMLESDLARTAARFATMEEAQENAHEVLHGERNNRMRELAASSNAELLETFAGFKQWHRA